MLNSFAPNHVLMYTCWRTGTWYVISSELYTGADVVLSSVSVGQWIEESSVICVHHQLADNIIWKIIDAGEIAIEMLEFSMSSAWIVDKSLFITLS